MPIGAIDVGQLMDSSLKSSHLPAYLAAAFAKKLARLSLSAPPAGCLLVIAMVHNLLRRHPAINCLVHRVSLLPALTLYYVLVQKGKQLKGME